MRRFLILPLAVLLSSIVVCFAVRCLAADQQTVLVVAQDGSQIFYHRNGQPTDMEEVPKGTELRIESASGERCFVTYNGKPAYIRRQFLVTKREFLEAQAAIGQGQKTNTVSELRTATVQRQAALPAGPIGYAWPKSIILITNTAPSSYKPLKNGGTYPLLLTLESGYSIICEGVDGQKRAALLPLRDRFGNPLNVQRVGDALSVSSGYVLSGTLDLGDVDLKPGVIALADGGRYLVASLSNGTCSIVYTNGGLTETVSVPEIYVRYASMADYTSILKSLISAAESQIATGGSPAYVAAIFTNYHGSFTAETAQERGELSKQYEQRATEYQRQKLVEEQKAKGLIEFRGEWVAPHEMERRLAEEAEFQRWLRENERNIYEEMRLNTVSATKQAGAKYPEPQSLQDVERWSDYLESLCRQSDAELCRKYRITQSVLDGILDKGNREHWPALTNPDE